MSNVQSIVTPAVGTNGVSLPSLKKSGKGKLRASTTLSAPSMTSAKAIEIAYEYGSSLAGVDGELTKALQAFKGNESVRADMLSALNVGYMVRKFGYTRESATRVVNLKKYNEKTQDDEHRTFDQQRVMDTVRVLWHRANKNAGTLPPKSENQIAAEQTRATKEADRKAHEARLIKADQMVNPGDDVDVFESLTRLVLTMKSLQKKHARTLVGDAGMAWRDWLAAAPVTTKKK